MIENKSSIENIIDITFSKNEMSMIVNSHTFKNDKSLGTTQQLKRAVNASRKLALMYIQCKEKKNPKHEKEVSFHYNAPVLVDSNQDYMGAISFKYSMLIFNLLLISSIWFVPTTLNEDFVGKGINVLNNVSAVLISIMLIQMYRFREEWVGDTGQVRRTCPHLNSE